jgi:hypothetical protein
VIEDEADLPVVVWKKDKRQQDGHHSWVEDEVALRPDSEASDDLLVRCDQRATVCFLTWRLSHSGRQ